jgi:hypothetical protein
MVQRYGFNKYKAQLRNAGGNFRRRATWLIAVLTSTCGTGLLFVVWGHTRDVSRIVDVLPVFASRPQTSSIPQVPKSGSSIERLDVEVITVRPNGFERVQITRPKGLFGIAVENRSGLGEVVLQLNREAGSRLHEVRLSREKLNWKEGLDLPPGHYVLTEANNPNWLCRITITAN